MSRYYNLLYFSPYLLALTIIAAVQFSVPQHTGRPASGGGGTTVTFVQRSPQVTCGGTACTATAFGSNTTAGNDIGVCYVWGLVSGTGNSLLSITDSSGNTYGVDAGTLITAATTNFNEAGAECGHTTSHIAGGADTVQCNSSIAGTFSYCVAFEVTPINSTNPDKTATGTGTAVSGSPAPATSSVTTTANGEFAFVTTFLDDGFGSSGIYTAGTGFTLTYNAGGGSEEWGDEYQNQISAGAITGNFGIGTDSGTWIVAMETLKP